MTSLRETLTTYIREHGYASYGEICQLVIEWEYKIATAERRLRGLCANKSEKGIPQTPQIAPVMKTGKRTGGEYIAGWEWKETPIKVPQVVYPQTIHLRGEPQDWDIKKIEIIIGGKVVPIFAPQKKQEQPQTKGLF